MPIADQVSLAINQPDVALIFEGGGMRNINTSGTLLNRLISSIDTV